MIWGLILMSVHDLVKSQKVNAHPVNLEECWALAEVWTLLITILVT